MPHLLTVSASPRHEDSHSRTLLSILTDCWSLHGGEIDAIDLAKTPPPATDEAFLSAAFTPSGLRSPAAEARLAWSDAMLDRIERADVLAIATPMYNFGMPAPLKAWFDQIIRPGRSFDATDDPANPYRGLIKDKPTLLLTARGTRAMAPRGALADMNMLDPHLNLLLGFIGIRDLRRFDLVGTEEGIDAIAEGLKQRQAAIALCVAGLCRV